MNWKKELEYYMDLVQEAQMVFQNELNEAQNEIDDLQNEDVVFSARLSDAEADVTTNENDIDGTKR